MPRNCFTVAGSSPRVRCACSPSGEPVPSLVRSGASHLSEEAQTHRDWSLVSQFDIISQSKNCPLRAGDPLFFSSLYTKTCTRTRSAETADATYGRLPRSQAGRRRAQLLRRTPQPRRHRCEAAASVGYAHAPGGDDDGGARGAWTRNGGARRVETRWRGAARPTSSPPVLLGRRPTSPCKMH